MNEKIPASAVDLKVGSKAKSVKPVQAYLEQFGWLESANRPFEHDEVFMRRTSADHVLDGPLAATAGEFDEATIEALKRFQAFAGLEVTGEMDEATRDKMNCKQCGVPHVLGIGEFVTGVGKWDTNNLTYSFQNYTADIPDDTIRWAIDHAFSLWSAETPLRFRRVADGTGGNIVIRFVTGDHGDGVPFDGPGAPGRNVLAHAFFPSNPDPIRGDTHFDDFETWTVTVPTGGGIDLATVAAHEFGHALGLRHSADTSALMAPFYVQRRFLSPDDIQGIQSLYGGPGPLENATWVHGNAALIEHPDRVERQRYYGFYNRIIGKPNTTNWIHFALPTPVIEDGTRLNMDRFMLRAVTGSEATLRDVHIRDGERVVSLQNEVNLTGSLSFAKFGVASMPDVRWGISVSLGFDFGTGSSGNRRVDLISAGFDYKK
jgi:peptidoglycan hydrolase-like protein with peptidoglycan-binding domain